jgi:anti-sigma B factor antagonist
MSTVQLSVPMTPTHDGEPLLSLDLLCRGSRTFIEVGGELDMNTAHLLSELVEHAAQHRPTQVILHMANVTFFCAEGINALLRARATITAVGGQLLLRDPSPRTSRVLTITGAKDLFPLDTTSTAPVPT